MLDQHKRGAGVAGQSVNQLFECIKPACGCANGYDMG